VEVKLESLKLGKEDQLRVVVTREFFLKIYIIFKMFSAVSKQSTRRHVASGFATSLEEVGQDLRDYVQAGRSWNSQSFR
jgi:hypothetical protein